MEPGAPTTRPTGMRSLLVTVAALLLPLSVTACGSGDDGDTVADTAPTSATTPSASPTSSPTSSPTVGSYPPFAPTDYTYTLTVQCFCANVDTPMLVTVVDSEVVAAVYGEDGGGRTGAHAGDPVDHAYWLTINDIIARANDTTAAHVQVDWPAGQDYPNSVFVDPDAQMADEEIGYTISDVQVR